MSILVPFLPVALIVLWFIWSFVVLDKYAYTDIETGKVFVTDERGYWAIGGGNTKSTMIDVENIFIDLINGTEIPTLIPDGNCIQVDCTYADVDGIKVRITYPDGFGISERLDDLLQPLSGDDLFIRASRTSHDGKVCEVYTFGSPSNIEDFIAQR